MAKCNNCKKRLPPSQEDVQICPYCGFGQGEGVADLSLVEPLAEEDQYNSQSKIQLLGKVALGVLLILMITIVGYALMNPVEEIDPNTVSEGK